MNNLCVSPGNRGKEIHRIFITEEEMVYLKGKGDEFISVTMGSRTFAKSYLTPKTTLCLGIPVLLSQRELNKITGLKY